MSEMNWPEYESPMPPESSPNSVDTGVVQTPSAEGGKKGGFGWGDALIAASKIAEFSRANRPKPYGFSGMPGLGSTTTNASPFGGAIQQGAPIRPVGSSLGAALMGRRY